MTEARSAASAPPTPRVLHLYRRFHPDFTGDGIYYQQLIPLLEARSSAHDVLVVETLEPPQQSAVPASSNYKVFYLSNQGHAAAFWSIFAWIRKHAKNYNILHIHTHIDRYFLLYWLAKFFGWRVIFSCTLEDSPTHLLRSYRPHFRMAVRQLMRAIDIFVAISPLLRDGITALFPLERARLIPQGVRLPVLPGPEQRADYRRRHGIGERTTVLVYVGSISARKNVAFLVEQMPLLRAQHADLKLVIVGPALEEAYTDRVTRFIAEHGLGDHILLTGYRSDPQEFYAIGDIFVFASESEGFGNVLLEAMIAGLPVVARQLDGVTDYFIRSGHTGFLFKTAEAYRAHVLGLIENPIERREIAQRGLSVVRRNFSLDAIAQRYCDLYGELLRPDPTKAPEPKPGDVAPVGCWTMNGGPAIVGMAPVSMAGQPPILTAVIDTEAEFDWSRGASADTGAVTSIGALALAQDLFERHGVRSCYVIDYPVASHAESAAVIRSMHARGAEIGVHLQPWTTPPLEEPVDQWHTFVGNLDADLERRKLNTLMQTIKQMIGVTPVVYKAGRYGLSRHTMALLEEFGFEVDLSVGPAFDFRPEGGPDFTRYEPVPYTFGARRTLLELPTTGGYTGVLRRAGMQLWPASERPWSRAVHLRGLLDRTNSLSRVRLSPEGHGVGQLIDLTRGLMRDGLRVFTLSLHSSSLKPGFTPYVRNAEELHRLTETMRRYFEFFFTELKGISLTPTETRQRLLGARP